VDLRVRERQRLYDLIIDENLQAEMLATPSELAQPGKTYRCAAAPIELLEFAPIREV
jgi:hypothetical protein